LPRFYNRRQDPPQKVSRGRCFASERRDHQSFAHRSRLDGDASRFEFAGNEDDSFADRSLRPCNSRRPSVPVSCLAPGFRV
jgi:hypothetical protein